MIQAKLIAPIRSPLTTWTVYRRLISGEGGFTLMVLLPIVVFMYLGSALRSFNF